MASGAQDREPERAWRRLRLDPDYAADWRAHAGPPGREAPPHAFRRQTESDLAAARWGLLAWEDPQQPQWASLFRSDVPTVEARVAEAGARGWRDLLEGAGATYAGLRLLDGALLLKVRRGRETGQVRVIDGAAFDPARSGLEVRTAEGGWVRVGSLAGLVFPR